MSARLHECGLSDFKGRTYSTGRLSVRHRCPREGRPATLALLVQLAKSLNHNKSSTMRRNRHRTAALAFLVFAATSPQGFIAAQDTASATKNLNRALVLTELGRTEQAIEVLEKVIAADSTNVVAYEYLAAAYYSGGRVPDAIASWLSLIHI